MDTINLFLMDMTEGGITSGVDRYLEMLLKGLADYPYIRTYRIRLLHSATELFCTYEDNGYYQQITIPLPQLMDEIIGEYFWTQKYNEVVYHLVEHLFKDKERILLHTHTLNLIDLALYVRSKVNCRIITHLHCIPWKSLYNRDRKRFNNLYDIAYLRPLTDACSQLICGRWEHLSYTTSDGIICVTECGREFIRKAIAEKMPVIDVVSNGMDDLCKQLPARLSNNPLDLIYVGVLSDSKGLFYILDGLREVKRRGYDFRLNIAGKGSFAQVERVKQEYSDLNLNLLGCVPFSELRKYYENSDIGMIASLQEQASYAAIEMAMFGLPVITTAVDGLDEIFIDEVNALKVNTCFSRLKGLSVDVSRLADRIIELLVDVEKRCSISKSVRKLYEEKLTLNRMVERTVAVYQKTLK